MRAILLAAIVTVGGVLGVAAAAAPFETLRQPSCQDAVAAVKRRSCVAFGGGVILTSSAERATQLPAIAETGVARFELHFGRPPPPIAVLEKIAGADQLADIASLRSAGFKHVLGWQTRDAFRAGLRESIRHAVETQLAALPQATRDAAIQQALTSADAYTSDDALAKHESDVLPHELGHHWLVAAFWPDAPQTDGDHYGGPGPDWMDEAGAILMENDRLGRERRSQFDAALVDADPPRIGRLLDLGVYLYADHPMASALRGKPATGVMTFRVLAGDQASAFRNSAADFYLTTRVFADYLIARSGDPAIFAAIAAAFSRGESIEAWLAQDGARYRLPGSVKALDADWRTWLRARAAHAPATT